jgi:hypothetical protein
LVLVLAISTMQAKQPAAPVDQPQPAHAPTQPVQAPRTLGNENARRPSRVPAGNNPWRETSLPLRGFAVKTELLTSNGQHIRYLPGPLARAMVDARSAEIGNANGKVKAIRLIATASSYAQIIGPPGDGRATGVRFTRWVRLEESATRFIEHHPRSWDYE